MTEKIYKISLVIFGLIAIASFGMGYVAEAAVVCPGLQGSIVNVGGNGSPATASVTNISASCTGQVTFSSYKMPVQPPNAGWLDTQVLFDSQTVSLAPGETKTITINTPNCKMQLDIYEGPVQPHLSDASGGFPGQNLLGWNINTLPVCGNNPPPQLTCSPAEQGAEQNQNVNFTAQGGTGTYSWSAANGAPSAGSGTTFASSFVNEGWNNVVVTSGAQTATCRVNILPPPDFPLVCNPVNQTVNVGEIAAFTASWGGGNYTWNSPGSPSSGVGTNFSSVFSTPGTQTVSVSDGTNTANCSVNVNQVALSCTPSSQSANVGGTLNFSAVGGNGSYAWNTGDGNPASGSGTSFSTSFATAGSKTITVTSAGQTATCGATISQGTCNLPQTWLTVTSNVTQNSATLNAYLDPQGQSTTYYFEYGTSLSYGQTTGAQTTTAAQNVSATITGLQPNTVYYYRFNVQNTCGNQDPAGSFTTLITPQPPYYPPVYPPYNPQPPYQPPYYPPYNPPTYPIYNQPVVCGPQTQNVQVGDWVSFWTSGGNAGNATWNTSGDANPSYGSGSGFGTRFQTPGQKTVTVNSGSGGSSQCLVNVAPKGAVLGAADIVTGPEDAWPMSMALGFVASMLVYYFYFRPRLAIKNAPLRIRVVEAGALPQEPKPKTELEKLLEQIKAGENTPDA